MALLKPNTDKQTASHRSGFQPLPPASTGPAAGPAGHTGPGPGHTGGLTLWALLLETLCQETEAVGHDPSWRGNAQTQRGPSHAPTEGFLCGMKPGDSLASRAPLPAEDFCFSLWRFCFCATFRRTRRPVLWVHGRYHAHPGTSAGEDRRSRGSLCGRTLLPGLQDGGRGRERGGPRP